MLVQFAELLNGQILTVKFIWCLLDKIRAEPLAVTERAPEEPQVDGASQRFTLELPLEAMLPYTHLTFIANV